MALEAHSNVHIIAGKKAGAPRFPSGPLLGVSDRAPKSLFNRYLKVAYTAFENPVDSA